MTPVKKLSVCVIEDDPDVSNSLKAVVTALGYDCRTFSSAEEYLSQSESDECDCLLVDYNLPGMNGKELLTQIQSKPEYPRAALYTGQINSRVRAEAGKLKNTPVIEKGDSITLIVDYLQSVFDEFGESSM